MKKYWFFTLILTLLIAIGCSLDEPNEITQFEEPTLSFIEILSSDALITSKLPQPPVWADCQPFTGLVVPAKFKKNSDSFDELYGGTMFDGKPLISDSKPGDQDYNGGRWHMNVLKGDVSPTKYAAVCTVEDLDLGDFEPAIDPETGEEIYFECPLKKVKN